MEVFFSEVNALGFAGFSLSLCVFLLSAKKNFVDPFLELAWGGERVSGTIPSHLLFPPFPRVAPIPFPFVFLFIPFALTISQENGEKGWQLLHFGNCLKACLATKATFGLSNLNHFIRVDCFFPNMASCSFHSLSSFIVSNMISVADVGMVCPHTGTNFG